MCFSFPQRLLLLEWIALGSLQAGNTPCIGESTLQREERACLAGQSVQMVNPAGREEKTHPPRWSCALRGAPAGSQLEQEHRHAQSVRSGELARCAPAQCRMNELLFSG